MLYAINKLVGCEAIESLAVEKEFRSGVALAKQKAGLLCLTVAVRSLGENVAYEIGDHVYVDAEQARGQQYAKKQYPIGPEPEKGAEDKRPRVIFVPEALVLMHEPVENQE